MLSSLSSLPFPPTIGRYEVARVLGQGAMGRVLLARDPVLNRDVAVKILRDDLNIPQEVHKGLVDRMRHEAQAAARVSHPNLVTLHDMGHDPSVGLFLVFEYVSGPTLKERLHSGRLPPHQAARLARELGSALATAHLAGVLHRDVKPDNVMMSSTGAKLADFGIAKIPDSTLTRTGTLVGTPAYCAPEALASGLFSPESDQFSLAATLYEAVSGDRAFPGDDAVGVAAKIATEDPRAFSRRCGLPDAIDDIFLRALAKDPSRRFASTSEFGDALAATLDRTFQAASITSLGALATPLLVSPAMVPAAGFFVSKSSYDPWRVAAGAAVIALVSGLIGFAASRGGAFFSTGAPAVVPAVSTPSASIVVPPPSALPVRPASPPHPTGPGARVRSAASGSAAASASSSPRASASSILRDEPAPEPAGSSSAAPRVP